MSVDLSPLDVFSPRHIGPSDSEIAAMLEYIGVDSLDELVAKTVPDAIRVPDALELDEPQTEARLLATVREIASKNAPFRSFIGMGYHDTLTPTVILRNVLESPGWYTQYTPYQAEIAQGRLEALLNFQTMVIDLTGLEVANASLLDEATACAEAMMLLHRSSRKRNVFFVSDACHPQNIELIQTRANPLGIEVKVGDYSTFRFDETVFGALLQYPDTNGSVHSYAEFCTAAHDAGAQVVVSADLLSLTLLPPPGEFGVDVAVGSTQRFGVPMGFGGPHAAYMSAREEFKRSMPGRIIGVSKDAQGNQALRMALQTREQHIRRDKATSNICTAQVLLAVMAGMYAVYHGPEGLKAIATRIHRLTRILALGLKDAGFTVVNDSFFDTLRVAVPAKDTSRITSALTSAGINLRWFENGDAGISLDEATSTEEVATLLTIFMDKKQDAPYISVLNERVEAQPAVFASRTSEYLSHPVFHSHRSETEMLRYLHRLQARDLSLTTSMIPLGSCTMKLNATTEMIPVTWSEFGRVHPFAPSDQTEGYAIIFEQLEDWLKKITGFAAVSFQPNSGAQGEYAGLLTIRAYHHSRGDYHRDVCLIPSSAHGTNPASAVMAGMKVVVVACDDQGNIDLDDLKAKIEKHSENLAALMVTYPSTHGVFETGIRGVCSDVHNHGGQVYMDGANLNAQVGLTNPGFIGADVCHLNLHKTFCIPHGGGGPGMGPIGVAEHLVDFLPSHPVVKSGGREGITAVSAAPYGSPSILLISWAYIAMMGGEGLTKATQVAILNANYMQRRLDSHYPVLYKGALGFCAHEFILDLRPFKQETGISDEDVAKRLMDYGFHAPTMSFPVAGTIMVEPTESENKEELDRFCDALIAIRTEIEEVRLGTVSTEDSVLKNAPHTADVVCGDNWDRSYPRSKAAFPMDYLRRNKFWPAVGRIDNAFGDRNLVCACPPMEAYETTEL